MEPYEAQTEVDFEQARFRAFLSQVAALVARRPNELLSFEAVRRSLHDYGSSYRGVRTIPIQQIVGTATNRYTDFDRAFLPAQVRTKWRWKRIDAARLAGENLPPVQLYQVGHLYFVRDGHHRVSVARQKGQDYIEAEIIEVRTRIPVEQLKKRRLDADDLVAIDEYATFLEQTQLDRLRPDANIRLYRPGGYARLLEHIVVHQYYMGLDFVRHVTWEEAVVDWYDYIYCPITDIVRAQDILKDFPNRTEADLYLWIMDHFHYLREKGVYDWADAATDLVQNYSPRLNRKLARVLNNIIVQWRSAFAQKHPKPTQEVTHNG
ncbi:MAG: transcriptional regulator [Anaerolineae bacterium]